MTTVQTKLLSCRISESLMTCLEEEARHRKGTITDVVMTALKEYFTKDKRQNNLETLLYEIVKTRAVGVRGSEVLRIAEVVKDMPTDQREQRRNRLVAELLEEAGKDAEAYLEARRGKS